MVAREEAENIGLVVIKICRFQVKGYIENAM